MNKIAIWSTPVGEYSINENMEIFIGQTQQHNISGNTLPEIIEQVEILIAAELETYKQGLESQIFNLSIKIDHIGIVPMPHNFRIKF